MLVRLASLIGVVIGAHVAAAQGLCTANISGTPVVCDLTPTRSHIVVHHDRYGVPHITAPTFYGLNFQIGFEDARDRLVQLEFFRRASKGTLAEVFGRAQLQADMDTRVMLYSEEERQYFYSTLPCSTQLALQSYADGINRYLQVIYRGRRDKIPHEFYNIGTLVTLSTSFGLPSNATYSIIQIGDENVFKPGPWTVTDSIAVAEMLVAQFGGGGGRQLRDVAIRNYLTTFLTRHGQGNPTDTAMQIFNDVRWISDPKAPTTVPASGAIGPVITETGTMHLSAPPSCELGTQATGGAATVAQSPFLDQLPAASARHALADLDRMRDEIDQRAKQFAVPRLHGSDGWVVTPSRAENHQALLWGGPQEGFDNPNVDNEAYGRTPDLAVGGMKIPGAPAILIGMTDRFAFTTTSGEMDNSTVYVETLDPARTPSDPQLADSQYYFLFNGAYHQMDRRVEVIHYASEDPANPAQYGPPHRAPILFNVFRVNDCDPQHFHGPVASFDLSDSGHPRAYTVKTAYWKNEQSTLEGFAEFNTAKNFVDFDNAVAKVVSLHNFFYADYLGNIAYWSAGSKVNFPPGFDDRFPSDGSGAAEWVPNGDGTMYTPFSRLIVSVNPEQGYLANWNTKPTDQPCVLEGNNHDEHWGEIYRSERIAFLLAHNANISVEDMRLIAKDIGTIDNSEDTVAPMAGRFVPLIRAAFVNLVSQSSPLTDPHTHPQLADAVNTLVAWNDDLNDTSKIYPPANAGHYDPNYHPFIGQPGLSILFPWWYAFKGNLFGGGLTPDTPFVGPINFSDHSIDGNDYLGETTYNMVLHSLAGAESGVPQQYSGDYFGGHRDEIVVESLNQAIDLLQGSAPLPRLSYGRCGKSIDTPGFGTSDLSLWGWPVRNNLDFDCLDSLADNLFAAGTLPTHFGTAPEHNRSTYMQIISASRPPQGVNVIAPGQSAYIRHIQPNTGKASGHVGDQADLFRAFQYKPMLLP